MSWGLVAGTEGATPRVEAEATRPTDVAEVGPQVSCSRQGCLAKDSQACAYVDRRGAHCRTNWCSEHCESVAGVVYCLRHAGVVRAVTENQQPMPDVNCRAPSLASWIAVSVEDDVQLFMRGLASKGDDLRMVSDGLRLVHEGYERTRCWVRSWKLAGCKGVAHRVDIYVAENSDSEVVVRINHNEVSRTVPPWIAFRMRGMSVDPDRDKALRRRYHEDILRDIRLGLNEAQPLV